MRQSSTTSPALSAAQEYCRMVCAESGSNFVKTFSFLSPPRRLGFEAFYAFCRLLDDAVDEAASPDSAQQAIQHWSQEVANIYQESPATEVGQALVSIVKQFAIPAAYLLDLIKGCEMDLTIRSYETFDDLKTYCYRVASCVGLVCLHLFEAKRTESTKQAAIDLGMAVQITNIIRDIHSDLMRGRIYLPQEDMRTFQVTAADLHQINGRQEDILKLLQFEIIRARYYYKCSWEAFPIDPKEKRQMLVARMMGKIYEAILNKIDRKPLRVLRETVQLSSLQKMCISGRVAASTYLTQ
jgi:phytoene synthase